jgi:hypothetical protein
MSKSLERKTASPRWMRFAFGGLGFLMIAYGVLMGMRHVFIYSNLTGQVTFTSAVIGTGVIFLLLAFLPNGDWVYRLISTKDNSPKPTLDEELKASSQKHSRRSRSRNISKL